MNPEEKEKKPRTLTINMIEIDREALDCFSDTGIPRTVIDCTVEIIHSTFSLVTESFPC